MISIRLYRSEAEFDVTDLLKEFSLADINNKTHLITLADFRLAHLATFLLFDIDSCKPFYIVGAVSALLAGTTFVTSRSSSLQTQNISLCSLRILSVFRP
jgi:hypothetical protein